MKLKLYHKQFGVGGWHPLAKLQSLIPLRPSIKHHHNDLQYAIHPLSTAPPLHATITTKTPRVLVVRFTPAPYTLTHVPNLLPLRVPQSTAHSALQPLPYTVASCDLASRDTFVQITVIQRQCSTLAKQFTDNVDNMFSAYNTTLPALFTRASSMDSVN